MLTRQAKIAVEFKLTPGEVDALFAAGLDTPRALREADPEQLPEHLRGKLARFHREPKGALGRSRLR